MGTLGPVTALSTRYDVDRAWDIDVYEDHGGYQNVRAALDSTPDDMIQMIKDSGLRGRGGAGFPTGLKWSFIAQDTGKPVYLVVNADESEPGTFKDRPLMERDPHSLVEGIIVSCLAIQSEMAYIYARGEFGLVSRRLRHAIEQAYERGYLGADVFGSGKRVDITLHRGAAAYICGEETALLDSLEGRRGQPRLRPPFPATHGLYGCPTTVNNVETVTAAGYIVGQGPEWFNQYGTEKSAGPKLMCISGEVKRPGNYEFALGTPVSEMIAAAGGMLDDRELKFFFPGGSSTPILTAEHADIPYTFEAMTEADSLLGTGALMVHSDKTSVVETVYRYVKFYEHESCGKCTPCREGGYWTAQVYERILDGRGRAEDLDLLADISNNIFGRSFCALGDALTSPVLSSLEHFRDEYEYLLRSAGRLPDHMQSVRTATANEYLERNDLATAGV
ncbi:NADH-quinone oxidoreductase subunit NuoF [Salsipaludibacter albus]|uniref:NADH-quinone oxidoreductase subunit NuoF n=1 Tax=Salsipaludibacter albus TaxID=2849650 RepID=UPI001EE49DC2|nr:NADH-quinone oxidoreductase subunit NuoF [Salsipaludibacter albus]MBY5161054.1 NADH-quinone oxidoreductase subunit NuoF [Salsipaludibacter albus]